MSEYNERTEQLIAAALAGDLTAAEQQELEALRAEDPSISETLEDLSALLPPLSAAGRDWIDAEPPAQLGSSITDVSYEEDGERLAPAEPALEPRTPTEPAGIATHPEAARQAEKAHTSTPRRRRGALFALAAAGGAVLGTGGTLVVQQTLEAPPEGPPGTYGVVEDITFTGQPGEVTVEGDLIAHTWGTETVLEIDGLRPGESFTVVLIAEDGEEFASGTFFGSEVLIECRMNAAVMRDEVERVEITDDDGGVIASADLPEAIDPEEEDADEVDAKDR